ncbi:hypothetical protein [Streptomyces sp. SLBN-134]|uniref:hypothetical protein n=1 Tax=Streptomyces sp. SLBN-134 TaxID=2768456 RepID=UPI00114E4623|nr:hypothetical protein [Streptomyces sp. SLBN-134]TQL21947.1 hypothetical protein FBY37_3964 [Streptomyces sp. SLBN-134]
MNTCGLCGTTGTAHLCKRDAVRLAERLADLPTLYDELVQCLVPRRYGFGEIVSTKGAAGPRSPLDEDVLDEITSGAMAATVHARRVDVQRVRWPHHTPPPPAGLAADCRWLAMELDWIAEHYEAAGDLAREIRALEGQARAVVGDPVPRRKVVGQCVAVVDDQGTVCGEEITHRAGEARLVCRVCRCVYEGQDDLLLLLHYQPTETA